MASLMEKLLDVAGVGTVIMIILIVLVYFLPAVIALIRKTKMRLLICILNVLSIATFFTKIYVPIVIWLVIMLLAIIGKRDVRTRNNLPDIVIQKEED